MSFASRSKGAGDAWRRFPMLSGCWKGFGPWPGLVYATGIFTAYMVASKMLKKNPSIISCTSSTPKLIDPKTDLFY